MPNSLENAPCSQDSPRATCVPHPLYAQSELTKLPCPIRDTGNNQAQGFCRHYSSSYHYFWLLCYLNGNIKYFLYCKINTCFTFSSPSSTNWPLLLEFASFLSQGFIIASPFTWLFLPPDLTKAPTCTFSCVLLKTHLFRYCFLIHHI
jgi:hypothetical protein